MGVAVCLIDLTDKAKRRRQEDAELREKAAKLDALSYSRRQIAECLFVEQEDIDRVLGPVYVGKFGTPVRFTCGRKQSKC